MSETRVEWGGCRWCGGMYKVTAVFICRECAFRESKSDELANEAYLDVTQGVSVLP